MFTYTLGLCCFLAVLLQLQLQVQGVYVTNHFFSSCTGTQSVLPNLSYGKSVTTGPVSWTCNGGAVNSFPWQQTFTWFYYATYPPTCGVSPVDECCHSTTTSTVTFYTTVFTDTLLGTIVTSTGNVTAGAFLGSTVIVTGAKLSTNLAQCNTAMGVEARSGLRTLTIVGGPTCDGVVTEEICPGLHFS